MTTADTSSCCEATQAKGNTGQYWSLDENEGFKSVHLVFLQTEGSETPETLHLGQLLESVKGETVITYQILF